MKKAIPWILCAALAAAGFGLHFHYQRLVASKDVELEAAEARLVALKAASAERLQSAERTLQEANDRALAASAKAVAIENEADARLAQLKADSETRLQAASLPETPITVSFRKALLADGIVATMRNASSDAAPVTALIERPSSRQKREFELVIDGNGAKEIGQFEGWAFVKGDTIQLAQPNHKPVKFTLN